MALSRERILSLMEDGLLTITPFDNESLTPYGYDVHIGSKVKVAKIADGYNTTIDTAVPLEYVEYNIPVDGFILDPMKYYDVELKETIKSDTYSMELVPDTLFVQTGLSLGVGSTPIPLIELSRYITVRVKQPLKIYRDTVLANAKFSISDSGDGFPSGTILMFAGDRIPYGWVLCNGMNGTPDLRNRFILGSDITDKNKTGGASSVKLTVDNLPGHHHGLDITLGEGSGLPECKDCIELSVDNTDGLLGSTTTGRGSGEDDGTLQKFQIPIYPNGTIQAEPTTTTTTTTVADETESTGQITYKGTTGNTGGNKEFSILPNYYTLMFIMKV